VSRFLAGLFLLAAAGCASQPPAPAPVAAVPPAPARVSPAAPAAMCQERYGLSPRASGDNVDQLLFASCTEYLPAFLDFVRSSCASAVPPLVEAIVVEQSTRIDPRAKDAVEALQKRYLDLARASRPFVPRACLGSFPHDGEDAERQIFEIKEDWKSCYPDAELLSAFTNDRGALVTYASSSINEAEYYWSVAMAPHMTPLGRQFLRKFLVCGQFVASPAFVEDWPEDQYPYGNLAELKKRRDGEDAVDEPPPSPPVSRHPPQR
jgi:hypothetical protein